MTQAAEDGCLSPNFWLKPNFFYLALVFVSWLELPWVSGKGEILFQAVSVPRQSLS